MSVRSSTYADYGINEEEAKKLKADCRNLSEEDKKLLFQCCISSAPGIEVNIYDSLVNGIGFDSVSKRRDMLLTKSDDFYGYQRKTLEQFVRMKKFFK